MPPHTFLMRTPTKHFQREVRRVRHLSAWIVLTGQANQECQVMDISKNGAKIVVRILSHVPQRFVEVDRDKALKQGVAVSDVYRTIQAYMGGLSDEDNEYLSKQKRSMYYSKMEFEIEADGDDSAAGAAARANAEAIEYLLDLLDDETNYVQRADWARLELAEAHWFSCSYVITSVEKGKAVLTNAFELTGSDEDDKQLVDEKIDVV